jgi:hypothetical protein
VPNSNHFAVRAAVAALFMGDPALAGDNVFENRDYTLAEGVTTQIHVNRVLSQPEAVGTTGSPITWTTEIEMLFKARKSADIDADDACDQLWTGAFGKLLSNQTLGGLAMRIEPGDALFDQDPVDTNVAEITQRFTVMHRTAATAIT